MRVSVAINLLPGPRRICRTCGGRFHIEWFPKAKGCVGGRRWDCTGCQRARIRDHYRRNRDSLVEYQKNYYRENREKVLARHKRKRVEDPFYNYLGIEERRRLSRQQHKRRRANPVTGLADRMRVRLRRALKSKGYTKKSIMFERLGYTQRDLWDHLQKYLARPCELCGFMLTWGNAEIDHIKQLFHAESEDDVWALNALDNLRLICGDCNRRRPHTPDKEG